MIEIRETTTVHTIFFVPPADPRTCKGERMDWLATILRQEGEPWKLFFRFRYIKDDLIGEASNDVKKWYTAELHPAETEIEEEQLEGVVDKVRLTAKMVADRNGTEYRELTIKGGMMETYAALKKEPSWAHALGLPS